METFPAPISQFLEFSIASSYRTRISRIHWHLAWRCVLAGDSAVAELISFQSRLRSVLIFTCLVSLITVGFEGMHYFEMAYLKLWELFCSAHRKACLPEAEILTRASILLASTFLASRPVQHLSHGCSQVCRKLADLIHGLNDRCLDSLNVAIIIHPDELLLVGLAKDNLFNGVIDFFQAASEYSPLLIQIPLVLNSSLSSICRFPRICFGKSSYFSFTSRTTHWQAWFVVRIF